MGFRGQLYGWCKIRGIALLTSLCPISVRLTRKKSSLVLSRARVKATALSYAPYQSAVWPTPSRCGVCFQLPPVAVPGIRAPSLLEPACAVHRALGQAAARDTWPGREDAQVRGARAGGGGESQRARASLFSWDPISVAWKRPEAFSNGPMNFPRFHRLSIGPPPS